MEYADQRELKDILATFENGQTDPLALRAALACLAEAGLLFRTGASIKRNDFKIVTGDLVSIVIVAYNSQEWLPECLVSLASQNYSPLEVIVVDNGSQDASAARAQAISPQVKLIRLSEPHALAAAINAGVRASAGALILTLNPDTRLEPGAIAEMVKVAKRDPACAAVAAKLRFTWATAFLNGLGNYVGGSYWSADNGLGHLDLGQFDNIDEIPSACFAAALIPRVTWDTVGLLDEDFYLYYEDSEWCYRARLLGHSVRAAAKAVVYHSLGASIPSGTNSALSPGKLCHVTYGRLRFALKVLPGSLLVRCLLVYLTEDCISMVAYLIQRRGDLIRARAGAWVRLVRGLPALLFARKAIRKKKVRPDNAVFRTPKTIAPPLVWHGLPELTWDLVTFHYLPLILKGVTRGLPEFDDVDLAAQAANRAVGWRSSLMQARMMAQILGAPLSFHRLGRFVQWHLSRIK